MQVPLGIELMHYLSLSEGTATTPLRTTATGKTARINSSTSNFDKSKLVLEMHFAVLI